MRYRHLAFWTACTACTGCASAATQAALPASMRFAELAPRQAHYDAYKLTLAQWKWQRQDGAYSWEQVEDLAKAYPETEDIYAQSNTRGNVIGGMAGAGAGLISGTLTSWALRQDEGATLSSDTSTALLVTGGVLLLGALTSIVAWPDPADRFADAYNNALRRELGIDEPSVKGQPGSVWLPRALGKGHVGWAY